MVIVRNRKLSTINHRFRLPTGRDAKPPQMKPPVGRDPRAATAASPHASPATASRMAPGWARSAGSLNAVSPGSTPSSGCAPATNDAPTSTSATPTACALICHRQLATHSAGSCQQLARRRRPSHRPERHVARDGIHASPRAGSADACRAGCPTSGRAVLLAAAARRQWWWKTCRTNKPARTPRADPSAGLACPPRRWRSPDVVGSHPWFRVRHRRAHRRQAGP
jgi:hypothetical protein